MSLRLSHLRPNVHTLSAPGGRLRVLIQRTLGRLGFGDDAFLLLMAVVIGSITGAAAVGFHELTNLIRDALYRRDGEEQFLYHWQGMWLLVVLPAAGGLAVGLVSKYVFRAREGHGVVDVMESVIRTSGFQRPATALEKTLTSALTLGSGGSTGAEGPIVQIGAAIASGVGQTFRVARSHMPILTGCGTAAGISAIFNAPFGGVLFTLEVILQDFSIRSFTPVVLASVIAQVTTQGIFQASGHPDQYRSIFFMPGMGAVRAAALNWAQVGNFALLGVACGVLGAVFIRLMNWAEHTFARTGIPKAVRPAVGGGLLGVMGVLFLLLYQHKPFAYSVYPMPGFFGDGYGVIQELLNVDFYQGMTGPVTLLLVLLCFLKMLGTSVTLGSGGSGGVIAPALFIGATVGAVAGHVLGMTGWFPNLQPQIYALVGMGAVLAAVVHAPMASILICFELTRDYQVMLPAMLGCIIAVAVARLIQPDSIYTQSLRMRGVRTGTAGDHVLLRRITVEQVPLDPVSVVGEADPIQTLIDMSALTNAYEFVVADPTGRYEGLILSPQLGPVLMDRDAIPVLVARDVMRADVSPVRTTDDLAAVFDAFSQHDVSHLPVCVPNRSDHVIGLISRAAVIRRYQEALKGND
jgi:CIC family chloride channel protein